MRYTDMQVNYLMERRSEVGKRNIGAKDWICRDYK